MKQIKIIGFIVIGVALIWGARWYNDILDEQASKQVLADEEKIHQEDIKALSTIQIKDLIVGTGTEAKKGDTLFVNYLGEFLDGKKFDSSYDRNQPFEFVLGAGDVIRGWDLGFEGMKVGGKRTLVVPPDLAYGEKGNGPIPPSSTLKFTVELLGINGSTSTVK